MDLSICTASQVAQWKRICLPMQEMQKTWVWALGQEDTLKEGMETHSSILAWRIPWIEDLPGGLQSIGSQRAGHDWAHSHISTCPSSMDSIGLSMTGVAQGNLRTGRHRANETLVSPGSSHLKGLVELWIYSSSPKLTNKNSYSTSIVGRKKQDKIQEGSVSRALPKCQKTSARLEGSSSTISSLLSSNRWP